MTKIVLFLAFISIKPDGDVAVQKYFETGFHTLGDCRAALEKQLDPERLKDRSGIGRCRVVRT